jgi:hypothetical protein
MKHILNTSVLTLTGQFMHIIVKRFLRSVAQLQIMAIIGQNMQKIYFITKIIVALETIQY